MMDTKGQIIVVEPQCCGFEHARVNGAFLRGIVQLAGNTREVIFFAEREHIMFVQNDLRDLSPTIAFRDIKIPRRKSRGYGRLVSECLLIRRIVRRTRGKPILRIVFFLSATPQTIIAFRLAGRRLQRDRVGFILHSVLGTLVSGRKSRAIWEFPLSLKNVLKHYSSESYTYVVLSERIYKNLLPLWRWMRGQLTWTDLPCWPLPTHTKKSTPFRGNGIRIGTIGVGHHAKGTHSVFQLASDLSDLKEARFEIVGYLKEKALKRMSRFGGAVSWSEKPLDADTMRRRIERLDYALFLLNDMDYRLIESASFCDAASATLPIIALDSQIMRDKFERFGNIGYLVRDIEEVNSTIRRIVETKPIREFEAQAEAIANASKKLSPEACVGRLMNLFGIERP
jgi:glycosyltransferase involved in cell wall biosynthesis